MVFSGGFVVGVGGGDFGVEGAEVEFSALVLDSCFPFLLAFIEFEALEFGAGSALPFWPVGEVL